MSVMAQSKPRNTGTSRAGDASRSATCSQIRPVSSCVISPTRRRSSSARRSPQLFRKPSQTGLCWRMTSGIVERSCSPQRAQIGMQCQAHEVGLPCLATRSLGKDGIKTYEINRDGGQNMLHLRFVQAIRACAS